MAEDYDFSGVGAKPPAAREAPVQSDQGGDAGYDFSSLGLPGKSEPRDDRPVTSDSFQPVFPVRPNEPWSEVLAKAPANIPGAAARTAVGAYRGAENTLNSLNPVGNMISMASGDKEAAKEGAKHLTDNPLVSGALAATRAYQNPGSVVESAKEAGKNFYNKWLTSEGWKKNIGEDIPGTALDIASVADPALRGTRMLTAVRGADLANDARLASTLSRTGLGISPADLTPAQLTALAENINTKGMTPATVRESIMQSSTGVAPPRGAATGYAPVAGAESAASARSGAGAAAATERIQGMGGTPSAPVDLGQAWHDARQAHKGDTKAAYDAWRQNPGEFSPEAAPYLSQWVQSSAAGADRAFFNPDYARGADKWGPTQAALDRFHAGLTNTPTGVLDLSHIDELRQNLRAATKSGMGVPGADSRVIEKAINGLDQGVSHAVAHPPFFSNSANGPAINKQLLDARAAHAKERTLFGDDAPTAVTGAHGALDASNGPDLHLAGAKLEDALLNKKTGPGLYSHMSSAGLGSTVDDYLRNRLLSGDSAKIDQVMSSPVGKQVFSNPADRAQINTLNASRKAFEAQHGTPEPVSVGSRVASVAKPLAAAGAMGAASHFLGHNPITALGIGAASGIGEKLGEHFFGNPARKELAGAPASFGNRAANVAQPTLDMMTGANAARLNEPDLPGHARGGRVGHQHLVDRLFTHIEKAKKAEKSRTSVLLHQPDEHIAKALNVAQAAI